MAQVGFHIFYLVLREDLLDDICQDQDIAVPLVQPLLQRLSLHVLVDPRDPGRVLVPYLLAKFGVATFLLGFPELLFGQQLQLLVLLQLLVNGLSLSAPPAHRIAVLCIQLLCLRLRHFK